MTLPPRIGAWLAPLRSRWQNVPPPVRRGLLTAALPALLLLWWAYAWLPVSRARAELLQHQPQWAAQLSAMQALADEARRLQQIAPVAAQGPARLAADRAALQTLFGAETTLRVDETRAYRLSVSNVSYRQWLERLDLALARYRLRIVSIKLKSVPAAADGRVDAEWVLADER